MNFRIPTRTFTAVILLLSSTVSAAPPRAKIAVMNLEVVQRLSEGTAEILSEIITTELGRAEGLEVIARNEITAMLDYDRQRQLLACDESSSCLAEIGGALGVEYMLTGQVGAIGSRHRLSLILVDVRSAKVVARAARFCEPNEDALVEAAQLTAREILQALGHGRAPSASAPVKDVPAASVSSKPSGSGSNRLPAYLTLGGGALLLAGSGAFALLTKSAYDDLSDKRDSPSYPSIYAREKGGIETKAIVADVLLGASIVAAGVGTVLLFTTGGDDEPSSVAFHPALGPSSLGIGVSGRL
ncbi:MAG: hypothetical protein ACOX6T_00655 [Myxococcales bacterium]|jgi:TolB-like protein